MQTKIFIQFLDVDILRNKTSILKDVSFSIRKGDFVYILGSTASGKSSLLQSIYAQIPIHKGSAVIDDTPIHQIDKNAIPYLRRKVGIVSDAFPLSNQLRVEENLDFVLSATDWTDKKSKNTRIAQVLDTLNIDYLKSKKVAQLTKKEYLQVLIARALLNDPSILLLDAPVQHLDVRASQEILNFIYQYAQKNELTVLLATVNNKIPELLMGDKILMCDKNTVTEIE
jgi:cell division transport system ATP-binding protein